MNKTVEQYVQMMRSDPDTMKKIPRELHEDPRIRAACRTAVLEDSSLLFWGRVPPSMLSEETCLAVVERAESGSEVLEDIPEECRTRAVCEAAIKRHCDNVQYVPREAWDQELLEMAMRQDPGTTSAYLYIFKLPESLVTDWLCDTMLSCDPVYLQRIPKEKLTRERCLDAVRRNGAMLGDVPQNLLDEEMCIAAAGQDGIALAHVPAELRTRAVCEAALNSRKLSWCPPSEREINDMYYGDDPLYKGRSWNEHPLKFIPEEFLSEELCLAAVTRAGQALQCVPDKFKTPRVCEAAVRSDPAAIRFVPEALRTEELTSLSRGAKPKNA